MGVPRRSAKQMQGAYLRAVELHRRYGSYRKVADEMAGPPDYCGGHTTARRWAAAGRAILEMVEDEQGNAIRDPSRKRPVRRDYVADELDELRAVIEQEADAQLIQDRLGMRKLQFQILLGTIQVEGLRRAPELPRVKRADGSKTPATQLELLGSLAAMQSEIDALIDRTLPDERTDP